MSNSNKYIPDCETPMKVTFFPFFDDSCSEVNSPLKVAYFLWASAIFSA